MAVFDDDLISTYRLIADNLVRDRDEIRKLLKESTTIDNETRILLNSLSSETLSILSIAFGQLSSLMKILNNNFMTVTSFEKFVESLPDEFYVQKKQWKSEIAQHRLETGSQIQSLKEKLSNYDEISDFVRWEKKFREDEVKNKESNNDGNYH